METKATKDGGRASTATSSRDASVSRESRAGSRRPRRLATESPSAGGAVTSLVGYAVDRSTDAAAGAIGGGVGAGGAFGF